MSLKVKTKSNNNKNKHQRHKKWFDKTLVELRRELTKASQLMQRFPRTPSVRRYFFYSLKVYNKMRKKKARQYKEKIIDELDELRSSNPQSYWKLLNSLKDSCEKDNPADNISISEWEVYYKNLNKSKTCTNQTKIATELQKLEAQPCFNELDFKIKTSELIQAIKRLKKF